MPVKAEAKARGRESWRKKQTVQCWKVGVAGPFFFFFKLAAEISSGPCAYLQSARLRLAPSQSRVPTGDADATITMPMALALDKPLITVAPEIIYRRKFIFGE